MAAKLPRRRYLHGLLAMGTLPWVATACGDDEGKAPAQVEETFPATDAKAADLIVTGGEVVTLDPEMPRVEAVAIKDGVFIARGRAGDIDRLRGSKTHVLDLGGGVAVPGLTDAHAHLAGLGDHLATVDLRGAASVDEVVARLKEGAPAQGWVLGRGWDQNLWPDATMPTHEALSQAFPDRPVWLRRVDGHAGWANAKVMELSGINPESIDPEGGEFLRDEEGRPTGVLIDQAMDVVAVPAPSEAERRRRLLAAQDHVLERGLVGVHEMGVDPETDALLRQLEKEGALKLRVHGYASESWFQAELSGGEPPPAGDQDRYVLIGVKIYVDGALGSRGAALLRPYADRPGHTGKLMHQLPYFEKLVSNAGDRGWQVAAHAIGDRGNRTILDAYDRVEQRMRHKRLRNRIEHAQIVDPADIQRFSKLRVIASMQPTHATSDMGWVPDRLGPKRLEGAYAWQRFLKAGVRLPLGSDFPVEQVDVTHGLYAAVTRADEGGKPEGGWLPDQRLSLDEAISGFSREAAYAVHKEESLGRVDVGFRGDLTCFRRDLWTLEPAELRDAEILATVIDGEVVHQAS